MESISRRDFMRDSAGLAGLAGAAALTGCNNNAPQAEAGTEAGYKETTTEAGYVLVENPDGPDLGYWPDSGMKIIEVDGKPFKDFEGTGELAPYADWRLSTEERAEDLGGREAHQNGGKYAVYPSGHFNMCMIPFVDGAFKLDGKTGSAAEVMTSYTIAFDEDKKYGELVGSGFSSYKITELLRTKYGFKGAACTDWAVLNDVQPDGAKSYRC